MTQTRVIFLSFCYSRVVEVGVDGRGVGVGVLLPPHYADCNMRAVGSEMPKTSRKKAKNKFLDGEMSSFVRSPSSSSTSCLDLLRLPAPVIPEMLGAALADGRRVARRNSAAL